MDVHAASSSNDLYFLRNVVRNLPASEPKLEYANWLASNGELDKSIFLHRFVNAFESLIESDLPNFDSVDRCWSRMVGADSLRMLIDNSYDLNHAQRTQLRDVIFRFLEPSIVVRYPSGEGAFSDFVPNLGRSHYFGEPELGDGVDWPTYADCLHDFDDSDNLIPLDSPCLFACQIFCKDLGLFVAGDLLNSDEMLSFFTYLEVDSLGSQSVCVITQTELEDLQIREQPQNATEVNLRIPPRPIFFLEELSLPQSFYSKFEEIVSLEGFGCDGFRLYDIIASAGFIDSHRECTDLPMFGYLHASSGADPSETKSHRLLASIRCSLDAGIITLGIDGDSLSRRDWKKSRIAWVDWDG